MTNSVATLKQNETHSLENCDREPVHIPGRIQDFAILLATDEKVERVTYCSANAADHFGKPVKDILNAPLSDLIGMDIAHTLRGTLSLSSCRVQRENVGTVMIGGQEFELWAHLSDKTPVIEIEKINAEDITGTQAIMTVRFLLGRLQGIGDLRAYLDDAVVGLRALTGFDRVMAYKFDHIGDGEILAEACSPHMEPFLGLRFPKWDIPNQARDIMLRLPLRIINDINGEDCALVQASADLPPLDITLAASRGTSPIHMEYLRNMGVRATMTLSIVVEGKLWGLFAFHHSSPYSMGPSLRGAAEFFAQFFCLQLEQRLEKFRNTARQTALLHQKRLLDSTDIAQNLPDLIRDIAPEYIKMAGADGFALIGNDSISAFGAHPPEQTVRDVAKALLIGDTATISYTNNLKSYGLENDICAGALAIRLTAENHSAIVFFREQASLPIKWAGAPHKEIIESDDGPRLRPRGSFKAYAEAVKDASLPWEDEDVAATQEIANALEKADSTLHRRLSQKEERQRNMYIAELNHRVRNILALIRSLSRRAQESTTSLESYARALEQRIAALGTAHDLAANRIADGVDLNTLFEIEMKPYLSANGNQLNIEGGGYAVRPDLAPIIALVAHELVTNCVKYGALSVSHGSVDITISEKDGGVNVVWTEKDGPTVSTPSRRGFGMGLIEKAIPYELDGDSRVDFLPSGVKSTFWLPGAAITKITANNDSKVHTVTPHESKRTDFPPNVLVVEDSMMVAMETADNLRRFGSVSVTTVATTEKARRVLDVDHPDFAVLDISLRNEKSFDIAVLLAKMGVPYIFVTGFGSEYAMPEALKNEPILTKPVSDSELKEAITRLYKAGSQ